MKLRKYRSWVLQRFRSIPELPVIGVSEYLQAEPGAGHAISAPSLDGPPIYKIENVLVHSDPSVLLVSKQGSRVVLKESDDYGRTHKSIYKAFKNQASGAPPRRRSGEWVALNNMWAKNFWHWLMECLPKVILMEASGFSGRYLVPNDCAFVTESMDVLGIGSERTVPADGESFYAEKLYLPTSITGAELLKYPTLASELRCRLLAGADTRSSKGERIYIARRSGRRHIVNEREAEALAVAYGFSKIYMEDHSLKEQIAIMRSCRTLLAPHGAGMAHVLFMPPGSLVLELFSPAYINPCMLPVIEHYNHRYFMIPSKWNKSIKPAAYVHGNDIEAFLRVIEITLRRELGERPRPEKEAAVR